MVKVRAAKGLGGKLVHGQRPSGLRLGSLARQLESQEHQAPKALVLRTSIVGRMGEGEEVTY